MTDWDQGISRVGAFCRLLRRVSSESPSSFWGLAGHLAYGSITPISAHVHMTFALSVPVNPIPPLETPAIIGLGPVLLQCDPILTNDIGSGPISLHKALF